MATLQEIIGDRVMMDEHLRERAGHEFDAMTPEQQRAAYIHLARVNHEIAYMLQLFEDGEVKGSPQLLLEHIHRIIWSTDGA